MEDKKHIAIDLAMQLFNLSCELDQLSSRARWLEDHIDQVRYDLMDLCKIIEEKESNK